MLNSKLHVRHDLLNRSTPATTILAISAVTVLAVSPDPAQGQDGTSSSSAWQFDTEISLEYGSERNFNLDRNDDENEAVIEPEINLEFSYRPIPQFGGFVRLELSRQYGVSGSEAETEPTALNLAEAYLTGEEIAVPGGGELSVVLGRQRFADERQWLYDEQLDGLTLRYDYEDFQISLSAVRQRNRDLLDDERGEETDNYIAYASYEFDDRVLGAYVLESRARQDERERPLFIGLQSYGELWDDTDYWLDLAAVRGEDGGEDIRGWGFDGGVTHRFDVPFSPSLVLGYAFGSGDSDPEDGIDRAFRQTGIQDNEQDLGGLVGVPSLGLVLEPELSNLEVLTVGIGVRPHERFSMQMLFHRYWQDQASPTLRDTNLDTDPNGINQELGYALDWAIGLELNEATEFEAVAGYFNPGKAFDDGSDEAFFVGMEISYEF